MQNMSFIKFKLIYIAKPIIIMLIVGCGNGPVKQIKKKTNRKPTTVSYVYNVYEHLYFCKFSFLDIWKPVIYYRRK